MHASGCLAHRAHDDIRETQPTSNRVPQRHRAAGVIVGSPEHDGKAFILFGQRQGQLTADAATRDARMRRDAWVNEDHAKLRQHDVAQSPARHFEPRSAPIP